MLIPQHLTNHDISISLAIVEEWAQKRDVDCRGYQRVCDLWRRRHGFHSEGGVTMPKGIGYGKSVKKKGGPRVTMVAKVKPVKKGRGKCK